HGAYKDGRPLLTVKMEPAFSELLRARYAGDIIPGYYTDKNHWSSLFLDGDVPGDVARAMLDNGYQTTLETLPKKTQTLITGE
ncbi:MmcQ/YjbR family DNA-binding protein, partial [bacterium]|nr:MmcQ/YjbR family DNA-binding protein [bacterium]